MATPVEIINDKITTESRNLDKKFLKFGIFALIIFLVILFIIFVCYKWKYPFFEFDYPIDSERWGQFGDFFGGVIGTIITFGSIVFVYMAFKEQRLANIEAHEANTAMIKLSQQTNEQNENQIYSILSQQFDSNFNTLLDLYKDSVSGYKSSSSNIPFGKASMSNLVASFVASTKFDNEEGYTKRSAKALNKFNDFFAKNMTIVNAHMRILYQIFNLLDANNIDEIDKVLYVKLLRSQLTDEELVLIRYNCMTKRGQKMQLPVFHYNILKHLPMLGLFEFKKYKKGLSNTQINLLNDELISWRKEITHLFTRQSASEKTNSKKYGNRYIVVFFISSDNKNYIFAMTKKAKVNGPTDAMVKVFDNYYDDNNVMENLLVDFHTELFRHSHFRIYNRNSTYRLVHNQTVDGDKVIFKIRIHQETPLIVSFSQIANPA